MRIKFLLITFFIISGCAGNKSTTKKYNSYPNNTYKKSVRTTKGTVSLIQVESLRNQFQEEFKTPIEKGKIILIHFYQDAPNCILQRFDSRTISGVLETVERLSQGVCTSKNAIDFFVYTETSPFRQYFPQGDLYHKDSGYFKNHIFTLTENCSGFYILKPDGKYIIFYGEDYFSEIKKFMEEA